MGEQIRAENQPSNPAGGVPSALMFWWLTGMGLLTVALASLIPAWAEYSQARQVKDQLHQEVEALRQRIALNAAFIRSYMSDPEALEQLAITDLRYRRPQEQPLPAPARSWAQVPPVAWRTSSGQAGPRETTQRLTPGPLDPLAGRIHRIASRWMGRRRTAAVVEAFCDPTSRRVLTLAALGLIGAAMVLYRPNPAND